MKFFSRTTEKVKQKLFKMVQNSSSLVLTELSNIKTTNWKTEALLREILEELKKLNERGIYTESDDSMGNPIATGTKRNTENNK